MLNRIFSRIVSVIILGMSSGVTWSQDANLYRFRNTENNAHLYTASSQEVVYILNNLPSWMLENIAYIVSLNPSGNTAPVYRFRSRFHASYFFTIDPAEREAMLTLYAGDWQEEGVAFYAKPFQTQGTEPVFRFRNRFAPKYFYTISKEESYWVKKSLNAEWEYEGIAWYAAPGSLGERSFRDVRHDLVGEPYIGLEIGPWRRHEGLLHGVPEHYDWFEGASPKEWSNIGPNKAIVGWGQAYEWLDGSPETNVRIQVRNMKLQVFRNGSWRVVAQGSESIEGKNWNEDFTGSPLDLSDIRTETDNGGGISFTMVPGYNFHWWIDRAAIPDGASGFYVSAEMRIIPNDDPYAALESAKYLGGICADYYPSVDYQNGPNEIMPGLAMPAHKFIKPYWTTFSCYVGGQLPSTVADYDRAILGKVLPLGVTY